MSVHKQGFHLSDTWHLMIIDLTTLLVAVDCVLVSAVQEGGLKLHLIHLICNQALEAVCSVWDSILKGTSHNRMCNLCTEVHPAARSSIYHQLAISGHLMIR